jgi:hypothetical protein
MAADPSPSASSTLLPTLLACALAAAVLSPVLGAGFFGDDYDLWHVGRELQSDPGIAFIGPLNFYRPANAWLFAAHDLVFGTWTVGYHLTTLLMHLGCGLLLGCVLLRFGVGRWGAAAGSAFWMLSPYAFEPVLFVNVSYNDLTVLLVWLGLACLWPGPGRRWTAGRLAAAAAMITFSVFCKESWVMVAGLAVLFDLCVRETGWRRAVRTGVVLTVPVVIYVALYVVIFSGRGEYYDLGSHVVTKIPHLWACFSLVGSLEPYQPGFGSLGALGLALMVGAAAVGLRARSRVVSLGFGWFFLSLLPILPVSWIPTRYTAVPLVGFVFVMAGVFRALGSWAPTHAQRAARVGIAAVAASTVCVNMIWIRGELTDMWRQTALYDRLLGEVAELAPHLDDGRPLVCVRAEQNNLHNLLNLQGYAGIEKFQFIRQPGPYGLASWPALLTFARAGRGDELYLDTTPNEAVASDFLVVAHVEGRFELLEPSAASLSDEVKRWRDAGFFVRAVAPAR